MFRYRDANDFNSFYSEAQRIQRQKNKLLFSRKYGAYDMAYRSIASQSDYNPNLLNQFRSRDKNKQINPPMRYTKVQNLIKTQKKRSQSMYQHKNSSCKNKKQQQKDEDNEYQQIVRKNTSYTNSAMGTEDQFKSVNSYKDDQQSSQDSKKNLKKFSVTLQHPFKGKKKKQSNKSYFVGITDIKQNSTDPHIKKTLHNILVKIGKTHPNPRDKTLASHVQVLSADIN